MVILLRSRRTSSTPRLSSPAGTNAFAYLAAAATNIQDASSVPPHLEDHWAARPTQQRALLARLFRWKADSGGREVILLAGAGRAEGCSAAETRLELKLLPLLTTGSDNDLAAAVSDRNRELEESEEGGAGDKKSRKPERRIVGIGQVRGGAGRVAVSTTVSIYVELSMVLDVAQFFRDMEGCILQIAQGLVAVS